MGQALWICGWQIIIGTGIVAFVADKVALEQGIVDLWLTK